MLHPPIFQIGSDRVIAPTDAERTDRAMDVLQYGTAILALVVVGLLAIIH